MFTNFLQHLLEMKNRSYIACRLTVCNALQMGGTEEMEETEKMDEMDKTALKYLAAGNIACS